MSVMHCVWRMLGRHFMNLNVLLNGCWLGHTIFMMQIKIYSFCFWKFTRPFLFNSKQFSMILHHYKTSFEGPPTHPKTNCKYYLKWNNRDSSCFWSYHNKRVCVCNREHLFVAPHSIIILFFSCAKYIYISKVIQIHHQKYTNAKQIKAHHVNSMQTMLWSITLDALNKRIFIYIYGWIKNSRSNWNTNSRCIVVMVSFSFWGEMKRQILVFFFLVEFYIFHWFVWF